jgi:hypothetical protein
VGEVVPEISVLVNDNFTSKGGKSTEIQKRQIIASKF